MADPVLGDTDTNVNRKRSLSEISVESNIQRPSQPCDEGCGIQCLCGRPGTRRRGAALPERWVKCTRAPERAGEARPSHGGEALPAEPAVGTARVKQHPACSGMPVSGEPGKR